MDPLRFRQSSIKYSEPQSTRYIFCRAPSSEAIACRYASPGGTSALRVTSDDELESLIGSPIKLVIQQQHSARDHHMQAFIAESPFLQIGTNGGDGQCDEVLATMFVQGKPPIAGIAVTVKECYLLMRRIADPFETLGASPTTQGTIAVMLRRNPD